LGGWPTLRHSSNEAAAPFAVFEGCAPRLSTVPDAGCPHPSAHFALSGNSNFHGRVNLVRFRHHPASPAKPLPNNNRLEGSGTGVGELLKS
jgi:hypothetical protein